MSDPEFVYEENVETMLSLATRREFGRPVEEQQLKVLHCARAVRYHQGEVTRTTLQAEVMLEFGISRKTASDVIDRTIDLGLLQCTRDGGNEAKKLYSIPEKVLIALRNRSELRRQIERVADAQLAEPHNPDAGRSLVPSNVFFDVRTQEARRGFFAVQSQMIEKIKDTRKTKG